MGLNSSMLMKYKIQLVINSDTHGTEYKDNKKYELGIHFDMKYDFKSYILSINCKNM